MSKYDGFADWADVANNFGGWKKKSRENLEEIPEPEEVLVAANNQECYEGDAWIVYRNGDRYFSVEGSHCSCYGFEDQWRPEEYPDAKTFLTALNKGTWNDDYGAKGRYLAMVKNILEQRIQEK